MSELKLLKTIPELNLLKEFWFGFSRKTDLFCEHPLLDTTSGLNRLKTNSDLKLLKTISELKLLKTIQSVKHNSELMHTSSLTHMKN